MAKSQVVFDYFEHRFADVSDSVLLSYGSALEVMFSNDVIMQSYMGAIVRRLHNLYSYEVMRRFQRLPFSVKCSDLGRSALDAEELLCECAAVAYRELFDAGMISSV